LNKRSKPINEVFDAARIDGTPVRSSASPITTRLLGLLSFALFPNYVISFFLLPLT